jgi:hypothetical protein
MAAVKKFYFLIIWLDGTVELCFKSLICLLFLSVCWELARRGCVSICNYEATLHTFSAMLFQEEE